MLILFRNIEEILAEKGETVKRLTIKPKEVDSSSTTTISETSVEIIVEDNSLFKQLKE